LRIQALAVAMPPPITVKRKRLGAELDALAP